MSLLILTASAGSGKTFRLTREYLKLALSGHPRYFSRILGMTFTNKAAWEMKESILKELHLLSNNPTHSKHYPAILDSFNYSEEEIRERAKKVQEALLQNYHDFSLSTIDSFFQRVVRAFFRELGLASNFDVELDAKQVTNDAISAYLRDMEEEDPLIRHIQQILEERVREGKSPNFKQELLYLSDQLSKEISLPDTIANEAKLREIRGQLYKELQTLGERHEKYQQAVRAALEKYNLTGEEYSYKRSSGVCSFLNKSIDKFLDKPLKRLEAMAEEPTSQVPKSAPEALKAQLEACNQEIQPLIQEILQAFSGETTERYHTNTVLLKNYTSFVVLSYLNKIINQYTASENIFLLHKTYRLLRNFMTESDSPLIYERIGSRYQHLFIDEFQDTSRYQYENIQPLLNESMSTGNFNLIVGDVKQSIYRFRNGDWKLLGSEVRKHFPDHIQEELKYNYRSVEEIIHFNNELFPELALSMQQAFIEASSDSFGGPFPVDLEFIIRQFGGEAPRQLTPEGNSKKGGHVQLEFFAGSLKNEDATSMDLLYTRLERQLLDLEKKGFRAGDIAILTRTKKQIKALIPRLAHSATEYPESRIFDFFSEEVLSVADSPIAQIILSVMQLAGRGLYNTRERQRILLNLQYFFSKAKATAPFSIELESLLLNKNKGMPETLQRLVEEGPAMGLDGFFYRIISELGLGSAEWESQYYFLTALGDEISQFVAKKGNDLMGFLEYWEEKGKEKSIEPPSDPNKMKLMTIHKSKGLAFQVVFMPFAELPLMPGSGTQNTIWVQDERFKSNGQALSFPVSLNNSLANSGFREDYWREIYYRWIDEINTFYVGVTRPRQALFIYAFGGKTLLENSNYLAAHLYRFSKNKLFKKESVDTEYGEVEVMVKGQHDYENLAGRTAPDEKKSREVTSLMEVSATGRVPEIKSQWSASGLCSQADGQRTPIQDGLIMHRILERIVVKSDLRKALLSNIEEGHLPAAEYDYWLDRIERALTLEPVSEWFEQKFEILNERDILLPDGSRYRPDRVILDGEKATVVDYKTGMPRNYYSRQIKIYTDTLKSMGYSPVEGWLFYTDVLRTQKVV